MCLAIFRVDRTFCVVCFSLTMAVFTAAMANPIGENADILRTQVEIFSDHDLGGAFALDPVEVRVAIRNTLGASDTFLDHSPPSAGLDQRVQNGQRKTEWHGLFSAIQHESERDRITSTEEFRLMPLEGSHGELAYGNGQLMSHSMYDSENRTINMLHNASVADEGADREQRGDVVVRPEPSGWTLMTTLLISVAVLGCCTRWFRQRRD